jgi:rRNA maturation protein Nop10
MSHFCSDCDVGWWPYQTKAGRCPQCGGGTRRISEPPSGDSVERHQEAVAEEDRRIRQRRFEAYYAARSRGGEAA